MGYSKKHGQGNYDRVNDPQMAQQVVTQELTELGKEFIAKRVKPLENEYIKIHQNFDLDSALELQKSIIESIKTAKAENSGFAFENAEQYEKTMIRLRLLKAKLRILIAKNRQEWEDEKFSSETLPKILSSLDDIRRSKNVGKRQSDEIDQIFTYVQSQTGNLNMEPTAYQETWTDIYTKKLAGVLKSKVSDEKKYEIISEIKKEIETRGISLIEDFMTKLESEYQKYEKKHLEYLELKKQEAYVHLERYFQSDELTTQLTSRDYGYFDEGLRKIVENLERLFTTKAHEDDLKSNNQRIYKQYLEDINYGNSLKGQLEILIKSLIEYNGDYRDKIISKIKKLGLDCEIIEQIESFLNTYFNGDAEQIDTQELKKLSKYLSWHLIDSIDQLSELVGIINKLDHLPSYREIHDISRKANYFLGYKGDGVLVLSGSNTYKGVYSAKINHKIASLGILSKLRKIGIVYLEPRTKQ